jgi:hypothetical protein
MTKFLLPVAIALGLGIAFVDSQPNWDDTGVTAVALFIGCAIPAAIEPSRPWLWALAVGVWVPVLGIVRTANYGSLLALVFAFSGAYAGFGLRKAARLLARDEFVPDGK